MPADDEEGYSPLANPELANVRAFAPRAAGRPGLARSWSQDLHDRGGDWLGFARRIGGTLAWFYPEPPWGRKEVCRPGSRVLVYWNMVVWAAMTYVAAAVPFLAAGFTSAYTDVREAGNRCSDHRRSLMDLLVDAVFLTDIVVSLHTAYYRSRGAGNLVLVDDLAAIRRHYFGSQASIRARGRAHTHTPTSTTATRSLARHTHVRERARARAHARSHASAPYSSGARHARTHTFHPPPLRLQQGTHARARANTQTQAHTHTHTIRRD